MPLFKKITHDRDNVYILFYQELFCEEAVELALNAILDCGYFSYTGARCTLVKVEVLPENLESFINLLKENELIADATIPKISKISKISKIKKVELISYSTNYRLKNKVIPNETITIIYNDKKKSPVKSLTLFSHICENTNQPLVHDIFIDKDNVESSWLDNVRPSWIVRVKDIENYLLTFCIANKFVIGPNFLAQISAFFSGFSLKIKLPDEQAVIDELCRLTVGKQYIDMIHVLNGIEKFSLTGEIIQLNGQTNPLSVLLQNLLLNSSTLYDSRERDNSSQLIPIINMLCEKGFCLSSGFYAINSVVNAHQTRLIVDSLLLLGRLTFGNDEMVTKNNLIKTALAKTSLWQTESPKLACLDYSLLMRKFSNLKLKQERYEAYQQYFISVSELLSDPERCMQYLKHIEESLAKKVVFDVNNFNSEAWVTNGVFSYPLPPEGYRKTKKYNTLKNLIASLWQDADNLRPPEVKLLESGEFWNAFGFLKEHIANKLICDGEMFWESGYALLANVHGGATHPLQIEILIQAHLQGDIPFPCNESIKDVLKVMVSKQMRYKESSIWAFLFDMSVMANFRSPIYMQSYIMNACAESLCPTLSFYFRESFWHHYQVTSENVGLKIEGQILRDLLTNGIFYQEMWFSRYDLQSYYSNKQTALEYYPFTDNLFKKKKLSPVEVPADSMTCSDKTKITSALTSQSLFNAYEDAYIDTDDVKPQLLATRTLF